MNTRTYVDGKLKQGDLPPAAEVPPQKRPINYNELRAEYDADDPVPAVLPAKALAVADRQASAPTHGDAQIKNTNDMRKFLLTQLVRAAKGEIGKDVVDNVCKISQQVYQATKLELEAEKLLKDNKSATIRALDLVIDDDAES
jgi:hypothetical protein